MRVDRATVIPIEEAEVGVREKPEDQRRPELYPDLDILISPKIQKQ